MPSTIPSLFVLARHAARQFAASFDNHAHGSERIAGVLRSTLDVLHEKRLKLWPGQLDALAQARHAFAAAPRPLTREAAAGVLALVEKACAVNGI